MKRLTNTTAAWKVSLFLSLFGGGTFFTAQAEVPESTVVNASLPGAEASVTAPSAGARTLPAAPLQLFPVNLPTREERAKKLWKVSLIPLAASQTLDISSSWGMRELNPVLAAQNGRFELQGALVKIGVMSAFVGLEYLIVRHHPNAAKAFAKINWSGAALTSSFAVHNYMIK